MNKFGLPTYPINDGMVLGERDADEVEWLLDHGDIQSDLYRYLKIKKISDREYRLVKSTEDSRYQDSEETVAGATTLDTLIEMGTGTRLKIEYWYWYPRYDN